MKHFALVLVTAFVATVLISGGLYNNRAWGADANASANDFPSVTSGPGNILPDSRLYFLDKLYQEFKLAIVFSTDQRALVHMNIAGERMAELRIMQARNNKDGMVVALTEVQREALLSAKDLRDAASQGKDVVQLARNINQELSNYRDNLKQVAAKYPDTVYSEQLDAAGDTLADARAIAQTALPDSDQEHELAAASQSELDEAVMGVSTSTVRLEDKLKNYEKYSSSSAAEAKQRALRITEIKKKIADLQKELQMLVSKQAVTPTPKAAK